MSVLDQPYNQPSGCFGLFRGDTFDVDESPFFNQQKNIPPEQQELDNLLSEAMNGLTFEERQRQQEILHGVAETETEDDDFLDRALQELDHHLSAMTIKQGSAYEVAENMDSSYVRARAFRLMFLRANEYDPKASAAQMFRFFESKYELFGSDKLVKDITIDDLDDLDIATLEAASVNLTGKDKSGRDVFFYTSRSLYSTNLQKRVFLRANFYLVMKSLQSEDTQRRGTISIWYSVGDWKAQTNDISRKLYEMFAYARALPNRKSAIHLCVDDMRTATVYNASIKIMQRGMRARFRLHGGSHMECHYQLNTFGIPPEMIPVDGNGSLKSDRYRSWHQSATFDAAVPEHPQSLKLSNHADSSQYRPNDVLFTGAKVIFTEGNQRFLSLIHDNSQIYDVSCNKSKTEVIDQIIDKIHNSGGRFLKLQKGSKTLWEEVPKAELKKKIAQSFRNYRRRHSRRKPKGEISS